MASTVGMVGRPVQLGDVLNGLQRTRFSLHFNMRRVWHWVVVHLTGVPVQARHEPELTSAQPVHFGGPQATITRLVDDYIAAQFARRLA